MYIENKTSSITKQFFQRSKKIASIGQLLLKLKIETSLFEYTENKHNRVS